MHLGNARKCWENAGKLWKYMKIWMLLDGWCWMIFGWSMMFHDNPDILIYLDTDWASSSGKSWCLVWESAWVAMIRADCLRLAHKLVVLHILSAGSSNLANHLDPEELQSEKRWTMWFCHGPDLLDAGPLCLHWQVLSTKKKTSNFCYQASE